MLEVGKMYIHSFEGKEQLVRCESFDSEKKYPFTMQKIELPYDFGPVMNLAHEQRKVGIGELYQQHPAQDP